MLTGSFTLFRLALRRSRIMIAVWILLLSSMTAFSAAATIGLYPDLASRVSAAEAVNNTPAIVALYGRVYDVTSLGAVGMIKMAGIGAVFVAIFAIQLMIRHTRSEEESGRSEIIGAGVIGRYAPISAAFLLTTSAMLALAFLTALGLVLAGLPVIGSITFGLGWAGIGIAFASVSGIMAQIFSSARAAAGASTGFLALTYLLRGIGDTAHNQILKTFTWLSPIGWEQQMRAYAGDRMWPLVLAILFSSACIFIAYYLTAIRDLGSGLIAEREGDASAAPWLRTPLALAWKQQRRSFTYWAVGFAMMSALMGNLASNLEGFSQSAQAREFFLRLGGERGLIDAFLVMELSFVGLFTLVYGIHSLLQIHADEERHQGEYLLSTATSRASYFSSNTGLVLLTTFMLILICGIAAGASHALSTGEAHQFVRIVGAALVHLPEVWIFLGLTTVIIGWWPRFASGAWVVLTAFFLLGELGSLFRLDQAILNISPFAHTPKLPGGDFAFMPLVILTMISISLYLIGLWGYKRRDLR